MSKRKGFFNFGYKGKHFKNNIKKSSVKIIEEEKELEEAIKEEFIEENINDKKENIKKNSTFVTSVLLLIIAQIIVKILGLVYRIAVLNIKGFTDEVNGYYSSGYDIYMLLLTVATVGLPTVISKLVSEKVAEDDYKGANRIFRVALMLFGSIGLFVSFILFIFSKEISVLIYNIEEVSVVLKVLAPAIVLVGISAIIRGYFTGLENIKPTTISQVLEQFLNCSLTILFAYMAIGRPPHEMAAAANISTTLAIVVSLTYLVIYYFKYRLKPRKDSYSKTSEKSTFDIIKILLSLSIPLTLAGVMSVLGVFIDSLTVTTGLQKAYGIIHSNLGAQEINKMAITGKGVLSKVGTVVGIPQVISVAFATMLVPVVSRMNAKKEKENIVNLTEKTLDISVILLMPTFVGLAVLAKPILILLFPKASSGNILLVYSCFAGFFIGMGRVIYSVLQGIGKFMMPTIFLLLGAGIKVILNITLIRMPEINIYGTSISSFVTEAFLLIVPLLYARKFLKFRFCSKGIWIKSIVINGIMGAFAYFSQMYLSQVIKYNLATIISIILSIVLYTFLLVISGMLKKELVILLPKGDKIWEILKKLKLVKEKN